MARQEGQPEHDGPPQREAGGADPAGELSLEPARSLCWSRWARVAVPAAVRVPVGEGGEGAFSPRQGHVGVEPTEQEACLLDRVIDPGNVELLPDDPSRACSLGGDPSDAVLHGRTHDAPTSTGSGG